MFVPVHTYLFVCETADVCMAVYLLVYLSAADMFVCVYVYVYICCVLYVCVRILVPLL